MLGTLANLGSGPRPLVMHWVLLLPFMEDFRDLTSWMSLTWSPIIFVALFLRLFQFNYVLFESKVPKIALSKVLVTCRRSAIFLK